MLENASNSRIFSGGGGLPSLKAGIHIVLVAIVTIALLAGAFFNPPNAHADSKDWDNVAELNGRKNVLGKGHYRGYGELGRHLDVSNSGTRGRNGIWFSLPYENKTHPELPDQKKLLEEARQYGFAMMDSFAAGNSSATQHFWYREVEIVPWGQEPTAKSTGHVLINDGEDQLKTVDPTTDYVPDNGTFIHPDEAYEIAPPERPFGLDAFGHHSYAASWTFGYQTPEDKEAGRLSAYDDTLVGRFLPRSKRGDLGIFKDRGEGDERNWYWCINPNASDPPTRTTYIQEPSRFSPQTNYSDLPQIAYIMKFYNTVQPKMQGDPGIPHFYEKMREYYNDVIIGEQKLDEPFPWDNGMTNREVRDTFVKLATLDGHEHMVDGEAIPVQSDYLEMKEPIDETAAPDDGRRITVAGLAIEYALQTYAQKVPRGVIDRVVGMRAVDYTINSNRAYKYNSQPAIRKMIRLISSIVITADQKNLFRTSGDITYKIKTLRKSSSHLGDGNTEVTVKVLRDGDGARDINSKGLQFTLPPGVTITNTNIPETNGLYTVPNDVDEITFSFKGNKLKTPIQFFEKKKGSLAGKVFMDKRTFVYNEEAGHWMAREFASWADGGELGQQIVAFTDQERDIAIPFSVDLETPASLRTTVTAGGVTATKREVNQEPHPAEVPLSVMEQDGEKVALPVTDKVEYEGFKPGATYQLQGRLFKVINDGPVKYVDEAHPVKTVSKNIAVNHEGFGTEIIDFGSLNNLEYGSSYVVYETAVLQNPQPGDREKIKHENPYDETQTFTTPPEPAHVKTVAGIRSHENDDDPTYYRRSTADSSVEATLDEGKKGIRIRDYVNYYGLLPSQNYKLTAQLVKIGDDDSQTVINTTSKGFRTSDQRDGNTVVNIGLNDQSFTTDQAHDGVYLTLKPGKYVIFEEVEHITSFTLGKNDDGTFKYVYDETAPADKQVIKPHKDPNDKAQTFIVREDNTPPENEIEQPGMLKTIAKAASRSATDKRAVRILASEAQDAQGVAVSDTVKYSGLREKTTYQLTGSLYEVTVKNGVKTVDGMHPIAQKTVEFLTTDSGAGETTLDFGKVTGLQPGKSYVVFESAHVKGLEPSERHPATEHKDPNMASQTIVVNKPIPPAGVLRTTVQVGEERAGAKPLKVFASPDETFTVIDNVEYEKLMPGEEYKLTGQLMEIIPASDSESEANVREVASASKVLTPENANGSTTISFKNVLLEPGKSYVVFETAVSKRNLVPLNPKNPHSPLTKQVISHHDPQDVLQSLVVERKRVPAFSTRVGFHERLHADKDAPLMVDLDYAKSYSLYDLVSYQDLTPGESYHLAGQLMDVTDGEGQYKQIAAGETTFTPAKESDSVKVNFTSVMLKPGRKYVVFEHLTGGNPAVDLTHQDVEDKAQTILSGELKTVACADDHDSSKDRAVHVFAGDGRKTTLTDSVYYAGLLPSSNYQLTGSLYQVETSGQQGDHVPQDASPVATKTITFTTSPSGSGKVELPFGQVTLTPGRKYVVFENARSESEIRSRNYATVENVTPPSTTDDNGNNGNGDDSGSGSADSSNAAGVMVHHVLRHENPQDRAQTVVAIEKRMPSLLTTVQIGDRKATSDSELVVESSSTPVKVVDNVYYTGFAVGKEYQVTGRLMKIIEGQAPVEVAMASSEKFTPVKANDQVAIHFAPLVLEPGVKYVVFETAVSTEKIALKDITDPNSELVIERVVHANANDKAQSIRVVKPNKPEKPTPPENPPTPPVEPPTPPENPPAPPVTPPVTPPDTPPTPPTPPVVPPDMPPAPPVPPVNPPSEPPTPPENPGVPPLPPTPDKPVPPTPPVPNKPPTPPATPPEKPGLPPTGSSIVGAVISMSVLTLLSAAISLLRKRLQDK